jgi:hypothetical protein
MSDTILINPVTHPWQPGGTELGNKNQTTDSNADATPLGLAFLALPARIRACTNSSCTSLCSADFFRPQTPILDMQLCGRISLGIRHQHHLPARGFSSWTAVALHNHMCLMQGPDYVNLGTIGLNSPRGWEQEWLSLNDRKTAASRMPSGNRSMIQCLEVVGHASVHMHFPRLTCSTRSLLSRISSATYPGRRRIFSPLRRQRKPAYTHLKLPCPSFATVQPLGGRCDPTTEHASRHHTASTLSVK